MSLKLKRMAFQVERPIDYPVRRVEINTHQIIFMRFQKMGEKNKNLKASRKTLNSSKGSRIRMAMNFLRATLLTTEKFLQNLEGK